MIFGNRNSHLTTPVHLRIENVELERVYENTFLGVLIDHNLSWKQQVNQVRSKISRSIGVLSKVRHLLNCKSMNILYCSLILPYLSYCVEIWGNACKTTLKPICTIQKRAMRLVNNVGFHNHTNPLFIKLKALKFMDLVDQKTALILFKARINMLPPNIQRLFKEREGGYALRGELNWKQNSHNTTMKSRCISVCGVRLWNALPINLKHCRNVASFKKAYKEWTIGKYRLKKIMLYAWVYL